MGGCSNCGNGAGPFAEGRELVEFFTRWQTTSAIVSGMLVKMKEGRATEEVAAREFLERRPEVWGEWVPAEVAARVKASLR